MSELDGRNDAELLRERLEQLVASDRGAIDLFDLWSSPSLARSFAWLRGADLP